MTDRRPGSGLPRSARPDCSITVVDKLVLRQADAQQRVIDDAIDECATPSLLCFRLQQTADTF